jgi:hypothetical protein
MVRCTTQVFIPPPPSTLLCPAPMLCLGITPSNDKSMTSGKRDEITRPTPPAYPLQFIIVSCGRPTNMAT